MLYFIKKLLIDH